MGVIIIVIGGIIGLLAFSGYLLGLAHILRIV